MKIRLKCITAGYKFNDIIVIGKDTISEKDAKALVAEGLAVEMEAEVQAKKETKKK